MNREQSTLIQLLKGVINTHSLNLECKESICWEALYKEAKDHHVHTLIYPILLANNLESAMDERIWKKWKQDVFYQSIEQFRHMRQVEYVLDVLDKRKIKVIALKGLVIRSLYPRPEMRLMCDADLLVHEEELGKAGEILMQEGYREGEKSTVHIQYKHMLTGTVELHWTIKDNRIFKSAGGMEEEIWKRAVRVQIGEATAYSLGLEDLMVHLCYHMAVHLSVGGFGLRQVLDLAMLIHYKREAINWSLFCILIEKWHIKSFVVTLFEVCEYLFDVKVPTELVQIKKRNKSLVVKLVEDLLAAGVYGRKDSKYVTAKELARDTKRGKDSHHTHIFRTYLRYIFPCAASLNERYEYLNEHPILLLPRAWVDRLYTAYKTKKYSIRHTVKLFINAYYFSYKRNQLLRKFNL